VNSTLRSARMVINVQGTAGGGQCCPRDWAVMSRTVISRTVISRTVISGTVSAGR